MQTEYIRESKPAILTLSYQQVAALKALGSELASKKEWWGLADSSIEERSVIHCSPMGDNLWEVTVRDAIGVVSTGDFQLIVEPKIPLRHFLHIVQFAKGVPRLANLPADLLNGRSFWDLLVAWFLLSLGNAVRGGLIRDYSETMEVLPHVRGRPAYIDAARRYYRGVLEFDCAFEDFERDTSMNRVLKAAALRVVGAGGEPTIARRIVLLMEDVGQLRHGDVKYEIERRSVRYADAFFLAKHILANTGRTLQEGEDKAWTFLFRTPELVEEGIRSLLQKHLGKNNVEKFGKQFGNITLNPDLVFATGIGDVKYKLNKAEWHRPDLYEVVTFAAGYKASRAAIINFCVNSLERPQRVEIGPVEVSNICWDCVSFPEPQIAEDDFVKNVRYWSHPHGDM
jgi:5-methylcytosine-specific restriction enzyme subunit McrC